MLANVKIEQDKENPNMYKVFIDGKQLEKIIHLDFEVNPLEIPSIKLNIEQIGGIDFEGQAEVNFLNTPFTAKTACKILRDELQKDCSLRMVFLASIYSALNDMKEDTPIDEIPEIILDRIIGDEQTCT